MIRLIYRALYATIGVCAIFASAVTASAGAIDDARTGDMKKLIVHSEPKRVKLVEVGDFDGSAMTFDDFRGDLLVVNFWATWCPPCLEEMPSLDRLQAKTEKLGVKVLAVAVGRNPKPAVERFLSQAGIENLSIFFDPVQSMAVEMRVLGLPVTVILDREGNEIARLTGAAEWDSESAVEVVTLLAEGKS